MPQKKLGKCNGKKKKTKGTRVHPQEVEKKQKGLTGENLSAQKTSSPWVSGTHRGGGNTETSELGAFCVLL